MKRGEGPTKEWERLWMTNKGGENDDDDDDGGSLEVVGGPKTSLNSKS